MRRFTLYVGLTRGVEHHSALLAATQPASAYDEGVVVVDVAKLAPMTASGDGRGPDGDVDPVEDQGEADDPDEDVYDRTISQVCGWFFTPPYG